MSNLIVYKGIEHERLGDAPFIGALLIAGQCHGTCQGCFNQHVKDEPNVFDNATHIIQLVKKNPLNEGIILGGLEWTEQPYDMLDLVHTALISELQVMIYTRLSEESFVATFPELLGRNIWCKFGMYNELYKSEVYISHGVKLATTNQYIKYLGTRGKNNGYGTLL
jgi:hypothetical protein